MGFGCVSGLSGSGSPADARGCLPPLGDRSVPDRSPLEFGHAVNDGELGGPDHGHDTPCRKSEGDPNLLGGC